MNTSDFRSLHAQYDPVEAEADRDPRTIPTPSSPRCDASDLVQLRTASLGRNGINCLDGVFSWRMRIAHWPGCVWWRS